MATVRKINLSPAIIGLVETTGLIAYIALVGSVMANGNQIFGNLNSAGFLGPMLFLAFFCFSAIFCVAIMGAYPFYIFWEKKDMRLAYKISLYSVLWLFLFIVFAFLALIYFR